MSPKIQTPHLARLAAVYIRQSSLGQVKNNPESYRVQKGLVTRAEQLGWSEKQIQTFEADQATSASKPRQRDDFDALLRMIQDQQVGIVFSVDVTRLARNAIDMSMLIHWCAVHGTLIADQHQVYDPATPEDSLLLGIQGVLAVSELHAIRRRLQAGLEEKARRGELHHSIPRGYVLCDEWEGNLQAVSDQERLLSQFDTDDPPRPTPEERALLNKLGERLDVVWHDASTDGRLKQQVVRLLTDHVYAEWLEERDEVVLWLKWTSGHHTELRSPRRRGRGKQSPADLRSLLETLRKIQDDASISRSLNRFGLKTESGQTWTARRVATARKRLGVASFDADLKTRSGWLTQAEAATKLKVSSMSVSRLIQAGVINSEGTAGLPRVIQSSDLTSEAIQAAVQQIQAHPNAPLPTNPSQKTLFF